VSFWIYRGRPFTEVSTTLDREFCIQALDNALRISNPEIFNTDQGSQFPSTDFTDRLKNAGIRISMDGRDRAYDNIFVERLWRTVKYEEVYLHTIAPFSKRNTASLNISGSTTRNGATRH
jgi:putative transposase